MPASNFELFLDAHVRQHPFQKLEKPAMNNDRLD